MQASGTSNVIGTVMSVSLVCHDDAISRPLITHLQDQITPVSCNGIV